MKFSIGRTAFTKGLNTVARAISTKTTIPILTGLKLVANETGIVLTGSDADISIETTIRSDDPDNMLVIQSEGAIVLPARFFTDIIKKLPEDTITLEVGENFQTLITSGQSSFTINGLDANNYPHLPEIQTTDTIPLAGDLFKQIISQTVVAVSSQESRPILTGVHFVLSENNLLAVATDSHRLSQRKVTLENPINGTYNFVIPGKSLIELSRMIDDVKTEVTLSVTENQALFVIGNTLFYSRLLEGNYPDTTRLIPDSHDTQVAFDSPDLLAAIERASLLSHESRNNVVKITVDPDKKSVTIYGNSPDVGNVEEDLEPKTVEGNELEISFNPDYMKDALRSFGQATINIDFTSSLRPFTLTPTEESESFIQLITPIRTF
ncbi:MAG: DNA polymerase III subunit beta [Lentilactobacillus diolivorans]|jgi:DNA polymerase-3 subunit beta|uniref:Beta sliding clamp n=2 Tax=Lentilactobacillus diolivorans TaxID=179838 RepID=A0A0R1STF3_9LACO|nr:DNA polymerase III subunit beta [Lentilactobacillus diolivorans]RRG03829.1 MAG: DNA polymerase III subunit beta [Lactobacillus sp.]KRL69525.1 DNA polymerase III subunit beta [Lentilactobacillus diolivorans DSM 14421]MCH4163375.1 DNA polymerase III subunit beta [Lentilactobacillus diolivorans]MDH5104864.1 DNA polymerase III subunit beta [Lentilactobacillus diolivorans]GEP23848.1 DNA polymerase III subunit beta [Lentilactobacillus diolivorans]